MDLQKQHHDLLFGIRRSIRYHSRRQGFFRNCHTLVMLIALLFGTTAVVTFLTEIAASWPLWVKLSPAVLVSIFTALDLVIRFNDKAWLHADFVRRFTDLEIQLQRPNQTLDSDIIDSITEKRLELEVHEPPVLRVLDTLCHNELLRAMGYEKTMQIKVGFFQRILAQFFDVGEHRLYS